jgi:hypothetical protein
MREGELMKALTLWRPWDIAILQLGKDIENRTWPPPRAIVGQRIALHAAKKIDSAAERLLSEIAAERGVAFEPCTSIAGAVFATAIVGEPVWESASPWFSGPVGWPLLDMRPVLDPPIVRGAQGLWTLPADLLVQEMPK